MKLIKMWIIIIILFCTINLRGWVRIGSLKNERQTDALHNILLYYYWGSLLFPWAGWGWKGRSSAAVATSSSWGGGDRVDTILWHIVGGCYRGSHTLFLCTVLPFPLCGCRETLTYQKLQAPHFLHFNGRGWSWFDSSRELARILIHEKRMEHPKL